MVAYFESLTKELSSMKSRIRTFIGDSHWPSDGAWKESILRSILRRYLPKTTDIGTGFIITRDGPSTQIDILIYDTTKPILFRDGDFVLVTPDATLGVIEVKTRVARQELPDVLGKINEIAKLHRRQPTVAMPFFGLYSYEDAGFDYQFCLDTLRDVFCGLAVTPIHILSFGGSKFIRFWERDPVNHSTPINEWRAYNSVDMAPAYFLHNVIAYTCKQSVAENDDLWFPTEGKESSFARSIAMNRGKTEKLGKN